jgi:putative DNA primase/helicase
VLEGLNRLLEQRHFTKCGAATKAVEEYKTSSDSVKQFLSENEYKKHAEKIAEIKLLYTDYKNFCIEDGYRPVSKKTFKLRLESYGIELRRRSNDWIAFISKDEIIEDTPF